ncbi:uncharacterized protein TNCV_4849661 [Trichonephila clavipes]|nr:uncharacterized protein TNCV_4849661 [Trichonephila clavipes]
MSSGRSLPQINLGVQDGIQGDSHKFTVDQGERHTGKNDLGSWSEPIRKLKIRRKGTLWYKRSRDSGCGGPERKQRNGQKHQDEKRRITVSCNNELQYPRKRYRDEIRMHIYSASAFNLGPRKGTKVGSQSTIVMKTKQGRPVRANDYNYFIDIK